MNELKSVLKRLQDEEVKLSSEKVELANINTWEKEARKLLKEIDDSLKKYYELKNEFRPLINSTMGVLADFSDIEEKAKDLGVKLPAELSKLEKEIVDASNELRQEA